MHLLLIFVSCIIMLRIKSYEIHQQHNKINYNNINESGEQTLDVESVIFSTSVVTGV